jgi:hypothetical protein
MTPFIPVAAAGGLALLFALTRKKLPQPGTVPGGGGTIFQPPPQVVNVPHPSGNGTVIPTVVQPPPVFVPSSTGLPSGGNLGQQGFSNTIDNIINNVLNNAGAPQGPSTTPPPQDQGLAPLPPPQVVSDGQGGLTTVQPRVPGDLGTQQFGSTIDQIIAQQLAQSGQSVSGHGEWNAHERALRVGRAFGGGIVGRSFGGGVIPSVGRAGYGY